MNFARIAFLASLSLTFAWLPTTATRAQEVPKGSADVQAQSELDPLLKPAHRSFESPERFILELRGGPYSVFSDEPYGRYFSDDKGPHLGAHLDGIVYRQPNLFYVTVGGSIGFVNFSGKATIVANGDNSSEETSLSVIPLTGTIGFRFDALPRRFSIPLVFAARVGFEWARWDTDTGARDEASGWSIGPVVSGQVALDLDTFERGGARALDEEWGINHTYLFGEVFRFMPTSKSLPLGTTSWLLGLGFVF